MKNVDFEKTLKKTLHEIPCDNNQHHLERISLHVKQEVHLRKKQEHFSFAYFLWKQVKFVGWKIWAAQGSFLFIISFLMNNFYGNDFWESPRVLIKLLCCISILIIMSSLPLIYRTVQYKMNEIEAAAYFSSTKVLLAKLTVIGLGDIFLLMGMIVISITKTSLYVGNAVFYSCMPFLLVSGGCLYMLGHFKTKNFVIGSMMFCILLMLFIVISSGQRNGLFYQSMNAGWLIVFVVLTVFCIQQLRYILNISNYAEFQIDS